MKIQKPRSHIVYYISILWKLKLRSSTATQIISIVRSLGVSPQTISTISLVDTLNTLDIGVLGVLRLLGALGLGSDELSVGERRASSTWSRPGQIQAGRMVPGDFLVGSWVPL